MDNIVIEQLSLAQINEKKIKQWPIWEKEISTFDWYYDSNEQCLFLEGLVEVEAEGKTFTIMKGDFVIFKQGLSCIWHVKQAVKKHYNFY